MTGSEKMAAAREILADLGGRDFETVFESVPDGRVPPEHFDYHVHPFWELKFSRSPAVLCVHAPNTVHCTTAFDLVMSVTYRRLRVFDRTVEFDDGGGRTNWLPELLDILQRIPETESFSLMRRQLSQAVVENCLILLRRFPAGAVSAASSVPLAERALDYMEHHYYQSSLSVGDIAGFTGVSPQMLNLALRRKTGQSIRSNLIRIRLEHAAELLKNPAYAVKDAAALTGWRSPFHFSTSFRRRYGFPPRQIGESAGPAVRSD
ncbi:MAG: helix-turn-helix transcriptional regulator [Lentisphaeria bacterium]|nr:helix-turn-helix transcriptional regulator [Lentisphaeria bacterium]